MCKDDRAKLTRYALLLQEFNYTVEHCPGKENLLPDCLSRNPDEQELVNTEDDRTNLPSSERVTHSTTVKTGAKANK